VASARGARVAAFDFTTKAILQWAVRSGELWRLRDAQGQPPGLIGWWPERAVTFLENHDTGFECGGQGHWSFPEDHLEAGYAYLLTHPGHPCIFLPHLFGCAAADSCHASLPKVLHELLDVRQRAGVVASSKVDILAAEQDLYVARVAPGQDEEGKHGLYVKMGSKFHIPEDLAPPHPWKVESSGLNFAVWLLTS